MCVRTSHIHSCPRTRRAQVCPPPLTQNIVNNATFPLKKLKKIEAGDHHLYLYFLHALFLYYYCCLLYCGFFSLRINQWYLVPPSRPSRKVSSVCSRWWYYFAFPKKKHTSVLSFSIFLYSCTARRQEIIKMTEQLIEAINTGDFEAYTWVPLCENSLKWCNGLLCFTERFVILTWRHLNQKRWAI